MSDGARSMDGGSRGRSIGCMEKEGATGCGDDQLLSQFTGARDESKLAFDAIVRLGTALWSCRFAGVSWATGTRLKTRCRRRFWSLPACAELDRCPPGWLAWSVAPWCGLPDGS